MNIATEIKEKVSFKKKSIVLKQSTDFWPLIVFLDSDFLWRLKSMQMQSAERRTHTCYTFVLHWHFII